ncbi:MAG: glycosyltransferase [Chloroflexota bacterium]|nr:glycosyltransferase [Chloroflexota bacterium]
MRVLCVMHGLPFPLTSGRLRHYYLLRELAKRHEVVLFALLAPNDKPDYAAPLSNFAQVHMAAARGGGRKARLLRALDSLGVPTPAARRAAARVLALDIVRSDDTVAVFYGRGAFSVWRLLRGTLPCVYDVCDAQSLHARRKISHARLSDQPGLLLRYLAARWRESNVVANSQGATFASWRDMRAATGRSVVGPDVAVVPNGVDIDYWQRLTPRLGSEIVFTGAMDYEPNTDAALQLTDVIVPLVRAKLPDVRLRIIGRDPPPLLEQRGRLPGVTVTGFVEDLRPQLERAAVFAAPLRHGAGIQNKLLEAMAMEIPSVASPLAAAGLRSEDGRLPPVTTARDAQTFANRLIERLQAAAADPTPHAAGREFVARYFRWPAAARRLEQMLAHAGGGDRDG